MAYPKWPKLGSDELERQLLDVWKREKLFRSALEATRGGEPFVFYEGPPTANGRPGIHHVFSRTIKDLICRFRTMQGREVTRIAGWDTHGLPVEIEVEKQLQLSGKRDIERYGVEEFNAQARESVFTYKEEWENLSDRIGYWLDYEHPYITLSNDYIETVWWLLHRLHERGLLYRGHRVLPYCPRCGTVLSSHELASGYETVTTNSIYVTFPLVEDSGRELLIWTTTPWTLLSNVAVAVSPELEYGEYRVGDRRIVLATARAGLPSSSERGAPSFADLGPERTFPGRELIGLRYERPLEVVPLAEDRAARVIVGAGFVSADDGSGLVHLAPAFGADDFAAGLEHGLAMARPVAPDGTFSGTTWPEIEGRLVTARETNDLIVQRLKRNGRWQLTEPHTHTYPHCWRCGSALIYYARDSWFVRTSAVKARMLEINREIDWNPPEMGAGRFGEWLENNVDWALSRDRYWGTPLPIWVCDQDGSHVEVIGGYEQLAARWGRPLPADFDPHKPFIDVYEWVCACGGRMRRAPEVIDAWFDSGAMPYAQWHYPFEHRAEFETHFPADFICEAVDQTRGWFYSLLAIAVGACDGGAYRHVIVNELMLDADGQKMSKSKGNVVDPWEVLREFGADTIRLYLLASSQVWLPKRFDRRTIPEVAGGFLNTLSNTYHFFASYAGDWRPDDGRDARPTENGRAERAPAEGDRLAEPAESRGGTAVSAVGAAALPAGGAAVPAATLADRWLQSRLDATVETVTAAWNGYDVTAGTRAVMDFVVDDLSNWYVRRNRPRFWAPDHDAEPAAVATLHQALVTVSRLLAPAAPFASDWMHRALTGSSVHLAPFPAPAGARDRCLEAAMDAVRRLASLARAARETADLGVRQPLARMQVAVPASVRGAEFNALLAVLQSEVNVRSVDVAASDTDLVRLRGKANFRVLGKRFGKRTPTVAAAVTELAPDQLQALESGTPIEMPIAGETLTILPEEVLVEREVTSDWLVQSSGPFVAALDPALTPELRREGLAREVVHRVQRIRREAGYEYTTRIGLWVDGERAVLEAVRANAAFVRTETLARFLDVGSRCPAPDLEQRVEIGRVDIMVGVRRWDLNDGIPA